MIRNADIHLLSRLMLPTKDHILRLILLSAVFSFFYSAPATAHVEKGTMPDSVAEMEYRILLEFKPGNLEVRNMLGMVLYRSKKFNEAANEFDYVLKKDPENSAALTGLGRVNIKLSNYQQAATLLKKAITIKPDDLHIYYYLGQTLEMQGDLSGAEEVYKSGLSRDIPQNEQSSGDRQELIDALKILQERKDKTLGKN